MIVKNPSMYYLVCLEIIKNMVYFMEYMESHYLKILNNVTTHSLHV
jgi:hypothetical protein